MFNVMMMMFFCQKKKKKEPVCDKNLTSYPPSISRRLSNMNRVKIIAAAATIATTTAAASIPADASTHIQVKRAVVIFRHGDRSPIVPPHGNVLPITSLPEATAFWQSRLPTRETCGRWANLHPLSSPTQERIDAGSRPWGQLTEVGAYQARDLGRFLRTRLIEQHGLLPNMLNVHNVRAHSTSIYRAQQTLSNVMLGLYGRTDRQDGSAGQVTVHVTERPEVEEYMYSPDRKKCSHLLSLHKILTHPSNMDSLFTINEQQVLQKLKVLFNYGDEKLATTQVRSTLVCLRSHNRTLPKGVLCSDVRTLESANSKMEYHKYANRNYFKLALGRLVPKIMDGLSNNDSDLKLLLFSGHDSTIKPLVVLLGLDRIDNWPKYCANILFEYGEDSSTREGYVRVLYNEKISPVAGCIADERGWIPLATFRNYISPYGLEDREHSALCNNFEF